MEKLKNKPLVPVRGWNWDERVFARGYGWFAPKFSPKSQISPQIGRRLLRVVVAPAHRRRVGVAARPRCHVAALARLRPPPPLPCHRGRGARRRVRLGAARRRRCRVTEEEAPPLPCHRGRDVPRRFAHRQPSPSPPLPCRRGRRTAASRCRAPSSPCPAASSSRGAPLRPRVPPHHWPRTTDIAGSGELSSSSLRHCKFRFYKKLHVRILRKNCKFRFQTIHYKYVIHATKNCLVS